MALCRQLGSYIEYSYLYILKFMYVCPICPLIYILGPHGAAAKVDYIRILLKWE